MSKVNALAGLVSYASDEESDDAAAPRAPEPPRMAAAVAVPTPVTDASAAVHPPPIPHCPWSACYDENSGFTYYWNQQTNAVTWEAPPEYLLALKLAQQQLHTSGSSEVSAEEWQLYQQALADKQKSQTKALAKAAIMGKAVKKEEKPVAKAKDKKNKNSKRSFSDDEDIKIEPITSYYQSDSDSNDEVESPVKSFPKPVTNPPLPKNPHKKQKTKTIRVEYGPTLPPNQEYTVPIGPELPPGMVVESVAESPKIDVKDEGKNTPKLTDNEDSQDESLLLMKLKDKAKLLEKLGGELPTDVQKIIHDEIKHVDEDSKDIDDLLEEIEKKELPKVVKTKVKIDMFGDDNNYKSTESSAKNSPKSRDTTPPIEAFKPLFPSSKVIDETEKTVSLFPSAANIQENGIETQPKSEPETPAVEVKPVVEAKPKENVYLIKPDELIEKVGRKKLRISNSVLPERKKTETPVYTTKYSQFIEGFSSERTGLGFTKEEDEGSSPKNTISYGNGLTFTKGETLNEDKKDEALDDLADLVEAKLKYLNELQPCFVPPLQEMMIQMQTLSCAYRAGALSLPYWRRWCSSGAHTLAQHEAAATPPGWSAVFMRSEGLYRYTREADGLSQWEYPAVTQTDMDICTTPPHPGIQPHKEEIVQPPLPPTSPPPPPPPLPPAPAPAPPPRAATPPPPAWDPPPPGCDDVPPPPLPPLPPEPPKPPKQEIGDELMSFYNDIAELEKYQPPPPPSQPPSQPPPLPPQPARAPAQSSRGASPEPPPPPALTASDVRDEKKEKTKKKTKEPPKPPKQEIGDELMSFYNDIAELEKYQPPPPPSQPPSQPPPLPPQPARAPAQSSRGASPEPPPPPALTASDVRDEKKEKTKKKTKVKISSSIGMKHKSVSTLVAKWQQVAEEINSD